MGFGKVGNRQLLWKPSRISHLQSIGEQHHLDAGMRCIVSMSHCIHNCLKHNLFRNLVGGRDADVQMPCANGEIDFGEDEIHRAVHYVEQRSFVNLHGGDRFLHASAVEMCAFYFR